MKLIFKNKPMALIFFYCGDTVLDKNISSQDVESGLYDLYPIIKYQDKNSNILDEIFFFLNQFIKE